MPQPVERYFDVAIAEQHAVTFAAGLACEGMRPVVAIYSTFLQRGYDQLIHDVALQKLVAKDFFWERDFGGGFEKKKSPFINFATALGLAWPDLRDLASVAGDDDGLAALDFAENFGKSCFCFRGLNALNEFDRSI